MYHFKTKTARMSARLLLTLAVCGVATAPLANDVVLISKDGTNQMPGQLLAFDGLSYEIQTEFGNFSVPADAANCEGAGCPVEQISYRWGAPQIGEQLLLTMNDGAVKLDGTVLAFSDGTVQISTQLGDFNVPMDGTVCAGPGCPPRIEVITFVLPGQKTDAGDGAHADHSAHQHGTVSATHYPDPGIATPYEVPPEIRLAGPGEVVEVLLPKALETYASHRDGILDLFDDHMAATEDVGELKHHEGGVGFEIKDPSGNRLLGLLGHHVKKPNEQIQMLASNETDVAFISGPVTDTERAIISDAGYGDLDNIDQQRVIAIDGLVAIVSPRNPVDKIALSDLRRVFAGQITNWSQIGGPDAAINVHTFATGNETFYKTRDVLLRPANLQIGADVTEYRLTREIVDAVKADPNGIGFVSHSRRRDAKALSLVMQCGLEIDATPLTIKTERYPLVQRIAAFSRSGAQSEEVADFLAHIESAAFDAGVESAGFVSLGVDSENLAAEARNFSVQMASYTDQTEINRAQSVLERMAGHSGLTSTFRFRQGSAELDQRAQRDLKRVVAFMNQNPDARYTVVGFADSAGPFLLNERLSQQRAQSVVDALRRADPTGRLASVDLPIIGAGELNAVACNDTNAGRATNRRVEIWMTR